MDRILRRELDSIARDRHSGAAELAQRGIAAVQGWLARNSVPAEHQLLLIARALLKAQPSIAPMLRLANAVALASAGSTPGTILRKHLERCRWIVRTAPRTIARRFAQRVRRERPSRIVTYSYSSTVLRALAAARAHVPYVICSEGRPALEGRATARVLARAGIQVEFTSDAALTDAVASGGLLVLGADAVLRLGFVNKVGTPALVQLAVAAKMPVWVVADSLKFWPEGPASARFWRRTPNEPGTMWKKPPRNVRVANPVFALTPYRRGLWFLTERGWLRAGGIRRQLEEIRISPRLKELID